MSCVQQQAQGCSGIGCSLQHGKQQGLQAKVEAAAAFRASPAADGWRVVVLHRCPLPAHSSAATAAAAAAAGAGGLVGTIFKSRAGTQASGTQVSRRGGRGSDASTGARQVAGSEGASQLVLQVAGSVGASQRVLRLVRRCLI